MAKIQAVWAIDIGQAALKALKLVPGETPDQVVAEAFDFIEYPKILSQPDADPEELVREALATFTDRNDAEGLQGRHRGARARRAWSSSSSCRRSRRSGSPTSSSSRPSSRSPSRSTRSSGTTSRSAATRRASDEEFTMAEVGLFAMKRDQINRAILPFTVAGIEVDIVQMSPIALYNFISFDQLKGSGLEGLGRRARHRGRQHRPDHHRRHADLAAERADRRQSLHPGPDQGAEAHLRQGRAPEAERHQGPRPAGDLHGDARRLQRLRQRGQPVDRLLLEHQPDRQDPQGHRPGQRLQAAGPAEVPPAEPEPRGREARRRSPSWPATRSRPPRSSRTTWRRSPWPTAWASRGWARAA